MESFHQIIQSLQINNIKTINLNGYNNISNFLFIYFIGKNIGYEGVKELSESLKLNSSLQQLDLRSNYNN